MRLLFLFSDLGRRERQRRETSEIFAVRSCQFASWRDGPRRIGAYGKSYRGRLVTTAELFSVQHHVLALTSLTLTRPLWGWEYSGELVSKGCLPG